MGKDVAYRIGGQLFHDECVTEEDKERAETGTVLLKDVDSTEVCNACNEPIVRLDEDEDAEPKAVEDE